MGGSKHLKQEKNSGQYKEEKKILCLVTSKSGHPPENEEMSKIIFNLERFILSRACRQDPESVVPIPSSL